VAGPLSGYVRTVAKPAAVVEWTAGKVPDPILARWQFGLGRGVAFASTIGTRWDEGFWPKGGEGQLAQQMVRWVARPARTPGFEVELSEQGDSFVATVHAESGGRFLNGLALTGRFWSPEGGVADVSFPQSAPGEYRAELPAARRGVYRLTVSEVGQGPRLSLAVAKNYAREWAEFGVDRAAAEAIARNGRGRVLNGLDDLRSLPPARGASYADLDWAAIAAALVLFVADVFLGVFRSRRERM